MAVLRYSSAQREVENQLDLASQYLGYELSFMRFGSSSVILFTDGDTSRSRVQQGLRILAATKPQEFSALMDQYVDVIKRASLEPIYLSSKELFKLDPLAESHVIRERFEDLSDPQWKSFLVKLSATDQLQLTPPALASAHEMLDRHQRTFANKDHEAGLATLRRIYCAHLERALLTKPAEVAKAVNRYFSRLGEPSLSAEKTKWLETFLELDFKGGDLPTLSLQAVITGDLLEHQKYAVFVEAVFASNKKFADQEKRAAKKHADDLAQNGEHIRRSRNQPKGTSTQVRDGIASRMASPDEPG